MPNCVNKNMGGKAFKKEREGRNFGNPKKYVISAKRSPPDMHVMCNNSVTHKRYTKQNFILQYMKIFIKTVDTLRRSQCKRTKCFSRNTMDINSGCGTGSIARVWHFEGQQLTGSILQSQYRSRKQ